MMRRVLGWRLVTRGSTLAAGSRWSSSAAALERYELKKIDAPHLTPLPPSDPYFSKSKNVSQLDIELPLQLGKSLKGLKIQWEQYGDHSLGGERTILVMPSFSHSSHVASNIADPKPGWWEYIVGRNKYINSNYFRVISASVLGAPYGTTSPIEKKGKKEDGEEEEEWKSSFPQITPADMAACHAALLDHLGIDKVYAVIGGSMGGMQALQFASMYPDRVERLLAISCTAKTTPGTVAYRRVQRRAILSDPKYAEGDYEKGEGPIEGMKIARELGMTLYRSRQEFDNRFDWDPVDTPHYKALTFDVEKYMHYQAEKFGRVYDPNCYLLLSKAMDLQDLGYSFSSLQDGIKRIKAKTYVIGVYQDKLIPHTEQEHIYNVLKEAGRDVRLELLDSEFGHDAMFVGSMQVDWFGPRIQRFMEEGMEEALRAEQFRYSGL